MSEDCLKKVADNRLVNITKVDTICVEIDAGHVDEVGGIIVIMMHCDQASAEGTLCNGYIELRWSPSSLVHLLIYWSSM